MGLTAEQIREIIRESAQTVTDPIRQEIAELRASSRQPETDWRKQFANSETEGRERSPNGHPALEHGGGIGGFMTGEAFTTEVIELLRPTAVVRSLNPILWPMENGIAEVPRLAGGAQASYIGENQNIGTTEQTFENLILVQKKLAAIVPLSNDMLRFGRPGTEAVVRDDVVNALKEKEDITFIRGSGAQNTPKGMLNWALSAHKINANATVNLANVTTDLTTMVNTLESANVRMTRPGWLMTPRTKNYMFGVADGNGNYPFRDEIIKGQLWTWPFRTTTQIPNKLGGGSDESEIYLVDFADAVIAESTELLIDTSSEAAYYDTGLAAIQAPFSKDQTVIRVIEQHDFGMRHDASIVILQQVTWGS